MKRLGVIGYPAGHSLSPRIHGHWFGVHGIEARYDIVEAADFNEAAEDCRKNDWWGVNVTLPHKESAYGWADECDDAARAMKAVNCLFFGADGVRRGFNTDAYGFSQSLDEAAADWRTHKEKAVVLVGAGGVARAIVYALKMAGFYNLRVINRSEQRARVLGDFWRSDKMRAFEIFSYDEADTALANAALVVNATSLGMASSAPLPLPLSLAKARLDERAIVFDTVYQPRETLLLKEASSLGYRAVGGLGMLIHQARLSFAHWFAILPESNGRLASLLR